MYFSELVPSILASKHGERLGRQILAILEDQRPTLKNLRALDIGSSSGTITNFLAPHFKFIIGIDIDRRALPKKKNFLYMDANKLKFKDQSFDIVICNQVYYWLPHPKNLMAEIYRVLKPGGLCFFANVNKYALFEPQYRKPLIAFLPRKLALMIEPRFACYYKSYWELQDLCHQFKIHSYTIKIMHDPEKYHFVRLIKFQRLLKYIPNFVEPISSNLIWVLEKSPINKAH